MRAVFGGTIPLKLENPSLIGLIELLGIIEP